MVDRHSFAPSGRFSVADRRATLLGRDAEMRALSGALAQVREKGEPRAVTVLGAGGIGKTRLVRDFLVRARSQDGALRVHRGHAREGGPAYEVFARVLRARFGLVEGMDPEAAKAQVRAQVAAVLEDRKVGDVAYFIGQLVELAFPDSPLIKAVEGDRQQLHSMRRAVIKGFLEADARRLVAGDDGVKRPSPLVLVFDDLQWAHDESLEKLAYLLDNLSAPALLLCLARPEMLARRDGWGKHGGARHTVLELPPLTEANAAAVMQDLLSPCGDADVGELVDAACTLAGGNPALLEQMVRIYLDTGVLVVEDALVPSRRPDASAYDEDDERWSVHPERLAEVRLPLTVEDAVQARIAALAPEERDVLERAAIMGSVFWLGGLVAIHRLDQAPPDVWRVGQTPDAARLRDVLSELIDRDYLLRLPDSTFPGDEEYVFKHNLERDALVRLTSPQAARRHHHAVAEWLAFKDHVRTSEEYLSMLAHHREKSGAKAQAAVATIEAADAARLQYVNTKASELYSRGLALYAEGIDAPESVRLAALHHYGDVLQARGLYDEALAAFREMLARAFRLDLRAKGGAAHSRIGRLHREMGHLEEAEVHLGAALALFEEAQDERGVASTLDDIGKLHWLHGDHVHALDFTARALFLRRRLGDRRSIALSLNNLGLVYQDSGDARQAAEAFEQALQIRREIGDVVGVCVSLNNLGTLAQDQRDDRRALALFQEAYEVAKDTGDRGRIALVLTNLGGTLVRLGEATQAVPYLRQAEGIAEEVGDKVALAETARGLAKAYAAQRDSARARDFAARAVSLLQQAQSKMRLGVALRTLGEVTAAGTTGGPDLRRAGDAFRQSIGIFEDLGNDLELLRSCQAYVALLRGSPDFAKNPALQQEAAALAARVADLGARAAAVAKRP